jgi:tetraacyldisaccharide 4'-kinase
MSFMNRHWYRPNLSWFSRLILPLSWLYQCVIVCRSWLYHVGILKVIKSKVPVIIVGNITVGGTGKSPMVIFLVEWLMKHGFKPGVVMRGYGGSDNRSPLHVVPSVTADRCGDEARMIASRASCPVYVCKDRVACVKTLLDQHNINVVVSDDGLQHYALGRDIEIVMADNERRFGNQYCLPSGPLREPIDRLYAVDFIVMTGGSPADSFYTEFQGEYLSQLGSDKQVHMSEFVGKTVHAVAGIGHPERFFQMLRLFGLDVVPHSFSDHFVFSSHDFHFADDYPVIMTEKDAVKCHALSLKDAYYLPVSVVPDTAFQAQLLAHKALSSINEC